MRTQVRSLEKINQNLLGKLEAKKEAEFEEIYAKKEKMLDNDVLNDQVIELKTELESKGKSVDSKGTLSAI